MTKPGSRGAKTSVKRVPSLWSSTDTLGSEVKRMIDAAADALDIETQWVDQARISEHVTASSEMGSVIKTCTGNEVYVAQFFRVISEKDNPEAL